MVDDGVSDGVEYGFSNGPRIDSKGHLDDYSGHSKQSLAASREMHSTIRSATLSGYTELARSVGLDPNRQMRKCGLEPSCLSDPDTHIDAAAVAKLLETSAAESGVEDFGLRLSTARRLSNLGAFSLVVREETTARRALETLARYLQLHSELLSIRIEDADKLVILRVDIVRGARMPLRQAIELFVGYLFRILQELLGPSWQPRRVLASRAALSSVRCAALGTPPSEHQV